MKNSLSLLALLSLVLVSSVQSFSAGPAGGAADTSSCSASTNTVDHASTVDRRSAISSLASSIFAAGVTAAVSGSAPPAYAASEVDPALKGTKKDPNFEACVSKCLYECTKPKGEEQKSRAECIPECKKKCATTKEQLMKGTPIKKEE